MNNKIINIKINDDDFSMLLAVVAEHIRKLKVELNNDDLDKNAKLVIEHTMKDIEILFAKLSVCKLYNEE